MVSAADGAREFYSTHTNPARLENAEHAAVVDGRIQAAWTGHPHLRIIDNSTDFEGKIRRTIAAVSHVLGIPEPMELERKYLLAARPIFPSDLHVVSSHIDQTYLENSSERERVRARNNEGTVTFTHCRKVPAQGGQRIELERIICREEYDQLLLRRDLSRQSIEKYRHCFVWQKRHYELDEFLGTLDGIHVLEVEVDSLDETIVIPSFLQIKKEVTGQFSWDNGELARIQP